MSGIFYDPRSRRLHAVTSSPDPGWTLVTHDLGARTHHCRRIMQEWLPPDEIHRVEWTIRRDPLSA